MSVSGSGPSFLRPYCESRGLWTHALTAESELPQLSLPVKNGLILELKQFVSPPSHHPVQQLVQLIFPELRSVKSDSLKSCINRLWEIKQKLQHKKKVPKYSSLQQLKDADFVPPVPKTETVQADTEPSVEDHAPGPVASYCVVSERQHQDMSGSTPDREEGGESDVQNVGGLLQRHTDDMGERNKLQDVGFVHTACSQPEPETTPVAESDMYMYDTKRTCYQDLKNFNTLAHELAKREAFLKRLDDLILRAEHDLEELEKTKGHYAVRNVNKRDDTSWRTRQQLIETQRSIKELSSQLSSLQVQESKSCPCSETTSTATNSAECPQARLEEEKKKKIKAQKSQFYYKQGHKQRTEVKVKFATADLKRKLADKESQIRKLEDQVVTLSDQLQESRGPSTKSGKVFDDDVRLCVMELAALQVSAEKIRPVIQTVAQHLFGQDIPNTQLPAPSTTQRIVDEGHFLAKKYIATELDAAEHWGCHRDGTARRKQKLLDTTIALDSGSMMSLGFSRVHRETGQAIADVTKSHIEELAAIHSAGSESDGHLDSQEYLEQSMEKLTFFMSDRAANEKKSNEVLNKWRTDLLKSRPDHLEGDLVESFHCAAHVLLGFHRGVVGVLEQQQKEISKTVKIGKRNMSYPWRPDVVVQAAVRTTSDVFAPAGEHYGVRDKWEARCAESGVKSLIGNYRDNRFNALFENSSHIVHHRKEFLKILKALPTPNLKLQAVTADLGCPVVFTTMQCLGVMYLAVTGPYWKMCTSNEVKYLHLYKYIQLLQKYLEAAVHDPEVLKTTLAWEEPGCEVWYSVPAQQQLKEAMWDFEDKKLATETLQLMAKAMLGTINKQLQDFLEGGQYSCQPSEEALQKTGFSSVTNLVCEHHFGDLDSSQRRRPNASLHHHSSVQLLKKNRTKLGKWFSSMTVAERHSQLKTARKEGPQLRQKHQAEDKAVLSEIVKELDKEGRAKQKRKQNTQGKKSSKKAKTVVDSTVEEEEQEEQYEMLEKLEDLLPVNFVFKENTYICVAYQDIGWFPGIVLPFGSDTDGDHQKAKVKFLQRASSTANHLFKWPLHQDIQLVEKGYVLAQIPVPELTASQRQYTLNDVDRVDYIYQLFCEAYF